ncbi:MAG: hypothetical protein PHP98_05095 [Kiritimatiellae bacterium]|nr:hypothetical protein [Kiritimatiellia bacterium]
MASVSAWIVREYFEMLGFLIIQPCKYAISGRPKRIEEETDLIAFNPLVAEQSVPPHILWVTADLKKIARAVIGVYGWHTERFYPAMLENLPELVRFAGEESARMASRRLGGGQIVKILCLPQLPVAQKLKDDALRLLKAMGIDGVLEFRTILAEIISRVDKNRNYEKSDVLQVVRIFKNYGLFREAQLELFSGRRKTCRRKESAVES